MSITIDPYYYTIKDYQEANLVIKSEIANLKSATFHITTTSMKLEKRILEFKAKVKAFKDSYLAKDPKVYNAALTNKENIIRLNKLEAFIVQCDKYLAEVKSINDSKFKYDKSPDDYSESSEIKELPRSEYLLYEQRQLNQQDELIENMISVATENRQIGKEMTSVITDQIVQIKKIDKDLETANNRVQKTNKRFEDYIELSAYCKYYVIILAQLCIIVLLVIL